MTDTKNEAPQPIQFSELLQSQAFYAGAEDQGFSLQAVVSARRYEGSPAARFKKFLAMCGHVTIRLPKLPDSINPKNFYPEEEQRVRDFALQLTEICQYPPDKYKDIIEKIATIYLEEAYALYHADKLKKSLLNADEATCYKYANQIIENRNLKFKEFQAKTTFIFWAVVPTALLIGGCLLGAGFKNQVHGGAAANHATIAGGFVLLAVGIAALRYGFWRNRHQPPRCDAELTADEIETCSSNTPRLEQQSE